ncbi:MAG: S24 family peptidase [Planctomycetota bacterium]
MPRPLNLSQHQLRVLGAIRAFAESHGYMPSVRELAARVKRSPTTVFQHLRALEAKGHLTGDGTAHGWQLVRSTRTAAASTCELPIHGTVAAGSAHRGKRQHPRSLSIGARGTYALLVRGHSMAADNIVDGDVVLVRRPQQLSRGAIVVAADRDGSRRLLKWTRTRGNAHALEGEVVTVVRTLRAGLRVRRDTR